MASPFVQSLSMTLPRFAAPTLFLLLCAASPAQDPVFKTGVNLVRVDVEVLSGRDSVRELNARDFIVKDQGKTVEVAHFAREEAPLDLMLLFDISGSMKPVITAVAQGSRRALSVLRQGDRVA